MICFAQKWPTIEQLDVRLLQKVVQLIAPFRNVTDQLQQDKSPTLSRLLPAIICLINFLKEQTYLLDICDGLIASLHRRFDYVLSSGLEGTDPIYVAASFLDPSVACMDVLLGLGVRAKKAIRFMVSEGEEQVCEEPSPVYSVFNFFGQDLRPKKQRAPAMSNLQVEIEEYFDQLWQPEASMDAATFWSKNKRVYPTLSKIAFPVLASPSHSGAVERMFSQLTLHTSAQKGNTNDQLAKRKVLMSFNKQFIEKEGKTTE